MIKLLLLAGAVVLGVAAYKAFTKNSTETRCEKCDGQGWWRGTRGEKEKCDNCWGSGKVPKS